MIPSPYDWLAPTVIAPFVGSFLGVLAVRLPAHEDVVFSRSRCRHCGHGLGAFENVPIVSWIVLAGRCRHCGAMIGWFYPAIEIAATLVAVWAATVVGGGLLWVTVVLGWTLLALAAMDVRALVLADALTLPLLGAGLVAIAVIDPSRSPFHIIGAAAGFALMFAVAYAYRRLRGREGLGLGDAKLMAAVGAWTGLDGIGSVLFLAALAGLAFATGMRISGRTLDGAAEIPFGAGIALGLWLVWLYGPLSLA